MARQRTLLLWVMGCLLALLWPAEAFAQAGNADPSYRTVFGLSPRLVVWIVAELHLMFAAFVLGVPIFAVIIEVVGVRQNQPDVRARYDALAYEFTKLLSAAFATTAALGGLLAFTLFSAYPAFMAHLTGVFHIHPGSGGCPPPLEAGGEDERGNKPRLFAPQTHTRLAGEEHT